MVRSINGNEGFLAISGFEQSVSRSAARHRHRSRPRQNAPEWKAPKPVLRPVMPMDETPLRSTLAILGPFGVDLRRWMEYGTAPVSPPRYSESIARKLEICAKIRNGEEAFACFVRPGWLIMSAYRSVWLPSSVKWNLREVSV